MADENLCGFWVCECLCLFMREREREKRESNGLKKRKK